MRTSHTSRPARPGYTYPSLSLAILHAVMIAAVAWTVIVSTPLYG